jgi:Na+-driven multidrug efflux pump
MVGNAIAQSAQPIISYNYGAERWTSVRKVRRLLLTTSSSVGAVVALLFVTMPRTLVGLFVDADSVAGSIAVDGFPYFAIGIIFFILNVSVIGYFQSIERIGYALTLVLCRGLVFILPCFVLLPRIFDVAGIWLAMPVAELLTLIVVLVLGAMSSRNGKFIKN